MLHMGTELGKGRGAGGWPADLSAGNEEDHHHHAGCVTAGGQLDTATRLLPAAGEAGPP